MSELSEENESMSTMANYRLLAFTAGHYGITGFSPSKRVGMFHHPHNVTNELSPFRL
jgi:hypothetical protein